MPGSDTDLTCDAFLGGALQILQPRSGYRAGVDPVLLAASVPAKPGQSLLDLGCGVGVAALCAGCRVPGLALTGLERAGIYAELARRNGHYNDLPFEVITGDLAQMPAALKARQFDHVVANPPYFDRTNSTSSGNLQREIALGEDTPLGDWVDQATRRVAPGGTVSFIHRAERIPDLLDRFRHKLGSVELLPLAPRQGRPARLCLLRGRKGGRADFRLHAPWVLHDGDRHEVDGESYTLPTTSILRAAAALPFPV